MAPFQPVRAFVFGTITAAPLAVTSGILFELGGAAASFGFYPLLALVYLTGIVSGWFLHGINAVMLTTVLSGCFIFLVGFFTAGPAILAQAWPLQILLLSGAAIGPILGLLTRPYIRKHFDVDS